MHQTYGEFEVLLIDNGSNYEKYLKLKNSLHQFNQKLDIKLYRNENNLYFTGGCNKAIKMTKGEIICLLNNDVIASSDFIKEMLKFLDNHPKAGMITPKIKIYENKSILWNAGSFLNLRSGYVIYNRGYLESDPLNQKYNEIQTIGFAPGTALFIKKKVIDDIGFMDEIFFMYHEDPDWNLRAQMKGYSSYYVPTTIVYHNVKRAFNENRLYFLSYSANRNSQILIWKYANFTNIIIFYLNYFFINTRVILKNLYLRKFRFIIILLNSIWRGFRIGLKRRTNRSCRNYLIKDYYYLKKIQNF